MNRYMRIAIAQALTSASLLALLPTASQAQSLSLSAAPAQTLIGQDVEFTIQRPANSGTCGVEIDYGDGTTRTFKLEGDKPATKDTHAYAKAGNYKVTVSGKIIAKGIFDITLHCSGADSSVQMSVSETATSIAQVQTQATTQATAQTTVQATTRALGDTTTTPARNLAVTPGERRLALVIGNDNYQSVGKLQNAVADARAIAASLQQAGFTVTLRLDVGERAMKEAVRNFKNQINGGDVAAFYYSGHGVQLGEANYLLPTDIKGDSEDQVKDEALPLKRVLDDLQDQKAKFSLAIIDACRNNPFAGTGRRALGGRGLAPTTPATGQMVLFSAGAGQQALDKVGPNDKSNNGLFTRVLLAEMEKPGLPVDRVLRNVRQQVVAEARTINHDQVPALYDQSLGEFYFRGGDTTTTVANPPTITPPVQIAMGNGPSQRPAPPVVTALIPANAEDAMWGEVKASGAKEYYDAYLKQYPKGKYIALARIELKRGADQEVAQRAQAEQQAWEQAKNANSLESYGAFINTWPRSVNVALAQAAQEKLKRESAEVKFKREAAQDQMKREALEQERLAAAQREREVRQANEARQVSEAKESQRAGRVFRDCIDCPEMVVIPAGGFTMGGNGYDDEKPVHSVTLGKPFALGKTEVTRGQFNAFVNANGYRTEAEQSKGCYGWTGSTWEKNVALNWRNPGYAQTDEHPVACVSWNDAQAYARWLSQKTGAQYRLPSEAEWEYACRASGQHTYCGNNDVNSVAWYGGAEGKEITVRNTSPVARKQPNAWGLHDMSGNLWEWVQDAYHNSYIGAPNDGSAWDGGAMRVLRGGSWGMYPHGVRPAIRVGKPSDVRDSDYGFRLARTF